MIKFFSNHTDIKFLEEFTKEEIRLIQHPYIEPEWSIEDIKRKCNKEITEAIIAEKLIINGDYSIVSIIVLARARLSRPTGFICMRKFNEPSTEKDANGNIIHRNVLKPVNVRWI